MNRVYTKKAVVIGMTAFVLAGCAGGEDNQVTSGLVQTTVAEETTSEKPLADIYTEIEETAELPKMVVLNDNYIANYFGIDLETLDEYVFTNAEEVIYADTVIMMKAKPGTDKETLKEALDTMITHKKAELENYLPEQFKIVEKAEIQVKGDYVYLVISEKSADIEAVIAQYIK